MQLSKSNSDQICGKNINLKPVQLKINQVVDETYTLSSLHFKIDGRAFDMKVTRGLKHLTLSVDKVFHVWSAFMLL